MEALLMMTLQSDYKYCFRLFGGIDIIVNNAGYTWDNVIQKMDDKQWDAILECHLTAPFKNLELYNLTLKDCF